MTNKLAQLLNLPPIPDDTSAEEAKQFVENHQDIITEVDSAISKIDAALPLVRDLDTATDSELDELATLAKTHAENLMDLGMNLSLIHI